MREIYYDFLEIIKPYYICSRFSQKAIGSYISSRSNHYVPNASGSSISRA